MIKKLIAGILAVTVNLLMVMTLTFVACRIVGTTYNHWLGVIIYFGILIIKAAVRWFIDE